MEGGGGVLLCTLRYSILLGGQSDLEENYAPSELINVVAHGRVYKYSRCIRMCVECHYSLWVVLK